MLITVFVSSIFFFLFQLGQVRTCPHSGINVKLTFRCKCQHLPSTFQEPRQPRLAHPPNPLIFPRPITPASEISLTSSGRQGDSLAFNHTSMLAPRSNLLCLSLALAHRQLHIDYPALAHNCDPSLSVSIPTPPHPSLSPPWWERTAKQPEGAQEEKERRERE